MTLLNPWVLLGIALAVAGAFWRGYSTGKDVAEADYLVEVMKEGAVSEQVRGAIRKFGQEVSIKLVTEIAGIRIEEKTVNRYITKEKEVHHVLTDVDCTYPPSTVRVLNSARGKKDPTRFSSGEPVGEVPATGTDRRKQPAADGRNG